MHCRITWQGSRFDPCQVSDQKLWPCGWMTSNFGDILPSWPRHQSDLWTGPGFCCFLLRRWRATFHVCLYTYHAMFGCSKVTRMLKLHLIIWRFCPFNMPSSIAHRTRTNIGIMKEYLICFKSAKNVTSNMIQVLQYLGLYSISPLFYNVPITPCMTKTPDTKREQMWCGTRAQIIGEASRYIIQHKISISLSPYTSLHLGLALSLKQTYIRERQAAPLSLNISCLQPTDWSSLLSLWYFPRQMLSSWLTFERHPGSLACRVWRNGSFQLLLTVWHRKSVGRWAVWGQQRYIHWLPPVLLT